MSDDSPKDPPKNDPEVSGDDREDLSDAQAAEQEQKRQQQSGQESPV